MFHFRLKVVIIGSGPQPYLFNRNRMLFFLAYLFFLALLVLVFTEIHYPADGRTGIWCNFDQIKAASLSHVQCFAGGNNPCLVSLSRN